MGPRAGLDRCGKSRPPPGFDPRTVQPVASTALGSFAQINWYICIHYIYIFSVFQKADANVVTSTTDNSRTTALEGGEGLASRPGRSLPPGKTRYPLYRRLGGPRDRCGKSCPQRDSIPGPSSHNQSLYRLRYPADIRSPDRPKRSQSLYQLRYPADT